MGTGPFAPFIDLIRYSMIKLISCMALVAVGCGVAGSVLPARAQHWSDDGAARYDSLLPTAGGHVYGREFGAVPVQGDPYRSPASYTNTAYPDPWQDAQQQQRDCNRGRLIGGILGGGLGYMASRDDGRSWAVPLGALLGSQVGCSAGSGRGPLSW